MTKRTLRELRVGPYEESWKQRLQWEKNKYDDNVGPFHTITGNLSWRDHGPISGDVNTGYLESS